MSEIVKEHRHEFFSSVAECNAQQELPLTAFAQRVISVATEHADILGCGYAGMMKYNLAWVLSRLTVEMKRMPGADETFTFTTWIENFNRLYSERNFEITVGDEVIGYVRTIWVAINMETRAPGDISMLADLALTEHDRPCPIEKQSRMRPLTAVDRTEPYVFRSCDIDFNRHVNSIRYIEKVLNQWGVDYYDAHKIARFEIMYQQEAHCGTCVDINVVQVENVADVEIKGQNGVICRSKITFK